MHERLIDTPKGKKWSLNNFSVDIRSTDLELPFNPNKVIPLDSAVFKAKYKASVVHIKDWHLADVYRAQAEHQHLIEAYGLSITPYMPVIIGTYIDETPVTLLLSKYVPGLNLTHSPLAFKRRNQHPDLTGYIDNHFSRIVTYYHQRFVCNKEFLTDIAGLHQYQFSINSKGNVDKNSRLILVDIEPRLDIPSDKSADYINRVLKMHLEDTEDLLRYLELNTQLEWAKRLYTSFHNYVKNTYKLNLE